MLRHVISGLFLSALAIGGAAAQDNATASAAAPNAAAQSGAGKGELRETHGAWEVRCYGANDCIMTQFHRRTDTTADAVFTILRPKGLNDAQGKPISALAEILVPLGVYLPGGLGLSVDGGEPRAAPYERCIPDGCLVRAPITNDMITQLLIGRTAELILAGSPSENVSVPIKLDGFSAAYSALEKAE